VCDDTTVVVDDDGDTASTIMHTAANTNTVVIVHVVHDGCRVYRNVLQIKSHGQKIAARLEAGEDIFEELRTIKGRAIVQQHLSSEYVAARVLCGLKQSIAPSSIALPTPLTTYVQS
jgi:hypothetical protein